MEEKKERSIPLVAASETGTAQTRFIWGCRTTMWYVNKVSRTILEKMIIEGDNPVYENFISPSGILSTAGHVKPCRNLRRPLRKAKYTLVTDSEPVL